jgi:hypothetical protein
VVSNSTQGINVCVHLFYVYVDLLVGSGLATADVPPKEFCRPCKMNTSQQSGVESLIN